MIGNEEHAKVLADIALEAPEDDDKSYYFLKSEPQKRGFTLAGSGSNRNVFLRDGYVYKTPKWHSTISFINDREKDFFEKLGSDVVIKIAGVKLYLPPFHQFQFDGVAINCMLYIEPSPDHKWDDWTGYRRVENGFFSATGLWSDLHRGNVIFMRNSGIPALIDP